MNIEELLKELKHNKIKDSVYQINPKICVEGALCLKRESDNTWTVLLVERGEYLIHETFRSENDACRFFLKNCLMDPTYRENFKQSDLISFEEDVRRIIEKYGFK